jgi:uncharacterized membrane protein
MASSRNITNIYESYLDLSFVDKRNFNGRILPAAMVSSFIPCHRIRNFYKDTLYFLHLHASLYYELYHLNRNNNNDITKFKKCIENLSISIVDGNFSNSDFSNYSAYSGKIGALNYSDTAGVINSKFFFSLTNFKNKYKTPSSTPSDNGYKQHDDTNNVSRDISIIPVLANISDINDFTSADTLSTLFGESNTITDYDKSVVTNVIFSLGSFSFTYDEASRYNMFKKVIKGILTQGHENIMSYLLYYTIYFHVIAYNVSIQNEINQMYLHNTQENNTIPAGSAAGTTKPPALKTKYEGWSQIVGNLPDFSTAPYNTNVSNINTVIRNLRQDVGTLLGGYLANGSAEYSDSKAKYGTKIEVLNDIKKEFDKIQNELNITIKDYNKYIKNFQNVKNYASFVIMVLIAVIIITILVTVLDSITPNFKSHFYVIGFILLSFITFVYYNKFKYINLYERFTNVANSDTYNSIASTLPPGTSAPVPDSQACIRNTINITSESNNASLRNTHKIFVNLIATELNTYNNAISNLISGVSTNLYTSNYGVFTKDGNNYLYNLYVEKKSQNEANRIKKVALANMLDTMKRHIVYLFNVILLISLLTIVLLLGLILFSNFPFFLTPIIILCVILISVIIIYFINSIVQPTRMLVNKNYWANKNPSKLSIAKLA